MKSFASLKFSLASLLLLAVAVTTSSQPNTGSIKGTVTDQLGGLVVTAFLDPGLAPQQILRFTVGVEHQFSKTLQFQLTYAHDETRRSVRTLNINAPLGGTFNPAIPTSGVRPFGLAAGNIYEYKSDGRSRYDGLNVSANGKLAGKIDFWTNYSLNYSRGNDWGTTGSPFDAYDYSNEWARANWDTRHWFSTGASCQSKSGFSVNTFIIMNSGPPFNITTGRDTNGDTTFSERPAFATDLNKPGVVMTPSVRWIRIPRQIKK